MGVRSVIAKLLKIIELPLKIVWFAILVFWVMAFLAYFTTAVQVGIAVYQEPDLFKNLVQWQIKGTQIKLIEAKGQGNEVALKKAKSDYERACENANPYWANKIMKLVDPSKSKDQHAFFCVPNDDANLAQWMAMNHWDRITTKSYTELIMYSMVWIILFAGSMIMITGRIAKWISLFLTQHSVQAREAHDDYFAWDLNMMGIVFGLIVAIVFSTIGAVQTHSDELNEIGFNLTVCTILAITSAYVATLVPIAIRRTIDIVYIWWCEASPKYSLVDDWAALILSSLILIGVYKNDPVPFLAAAALGLLPDIYGTLKRRSSSGSGIASQHYLQPRSQRIIRSMCLVCGLGMLLVGVLIDIPLSIDDLSFQALNDRSKSSKFLLVSGIVIASFFYGLKTSPSKSRNINVR